MLVSMECLIGAAYTRKVQAAGLAGAIRPSMGRVDARFADWRIGVASHWAQLWVDRNFALDYTLKSLEKVLDGPPRHAVRQARMVLKDAAYTVLGEMIAAIETEPRASRRRREPAVATRIGAALDVQLGLLHARMEDTVREVAVSLPAGHVGTLYREYERWQSADRMAADQRGGPLWHLTRRARPAARPAPAAGDPAGRRCHVAAFSGIGTQLNSGQNRR